MELFTVRVRLEEETERTCRFEEESAVPILARVCVNKVVFLALGRVPKELSISVSTDEEEEE